MGIDREVRAIDPGSRRVVHKPRELAVDRVFDALADPTRRQVVQLLGTRPWRAGELAGAIGTSAPSMSRHLRILLDAGVVADERRPEDARLRVFRLRPESIGAMQAWLDAARSSGRQVPAPSQRAVHT